MANIPASSVEYAPPSELVDACAAGECVLYAGAGLSARSGFPVYKSFLEELLRWATHENLIEAESASTYQAGIEDGDFGSAADGIVSDLSIHSSALEQYLRSIFLRTASLSDAHRILGELPFCAGLTTNFDTFLEQTFASRTARICTPRDFEALLEALHKRDFFILKLYGDLTRPETLMISPAQFEDVVREMQPFSRFMETLFFSKTILFVGASLEGIEDYLKGISLRKQTETRQHFAVVGLIGEGWKAKAYSLEKRYGIRVLPYLHSPQHKEMVDFLTRLKRQVHRRLGPATKSDPVARLKRIRLENIGPFEDLELSLDPQWNILLGDNGVGKSVILRAIATCICGRDAQPYAARLIRLGKSSAMITLETESITYKTEIRLTTSGPAEITSIPVRPLEAENWLVLGFPPLRAGSWERPKSPETTAVGLPTPDDVLPLIAGGPDPRLDKLKQWIVNLDYQSKHEQATTSTTGGRYEKILNEVFRIIGELTEGVTIKRGEVNPQTYEISVVTDDGDLPIEAVSQGTTSLIGWVGIVLQRLYEIYSSDDDPMQRYALVLMDEIDAHLHPSWQQSLVYDLGKIFPNVQFVATTHSPLIVGGMPPEQIFRFARDDEGKVVRLKIDADMIQGRTDQILTTSLFGLKTTLDKQTQLEIEKYKSLLGKRHRAPEEERTFQKLRGVLQFRIPSASLTLEERREAVRDREALSEQVRIKSREVPDKAFSRSTSRRKLS